MFLFIAAMALLLNRLLLLLILTVLGALVVDSFL